MNTYTYPRGLYRSRHGMVLGVCRGLAEYFDLSVGWVRFFSVLAFVFTGFWPVGVVYLILALLMKPAPVIPPHNPEEAEFYNSYTHSRHMAVNRLRKTYQNLDRRLRRMEDTVTSRDFSWQSRANR
ncbi:MAG: envelope stress response membrane protein PspC [Deltaproteobacteria bacterium]|nr:envelope stress response membrane protein PspC [Deltaproteobacteria bacterium]